MNAGALFRQMMSERRQFMKGTADHEYRTRAARKYLWMMRGVPTSEWSY